MILDEAEFEKIEKKNKDLSTLSVAELNEYIDVLEKEILRAKDEIAKKESHKNAADSFFKN